MGMTQAELALRMGRPKEKINELIKGREPLTIETAFQLERVLGVPASFWINREKDYRKELFEVEQEERFEKYKEWLNRFPVKELTALGFLPAQGGFTVVFDELLKFFGVASPAEWDSIYLSDVAVSYRMSLKPLKNPYAMASWLRVGELEVSRQDLNRFSEVEFKKGLRKAKSLAYHMPPDFDVQLKEICAASGVALVLTPCIAGAPISGASRWIRGVPVIQLSDRFKTDDQFWFTFFHEAAHILLHGKKEVFLEEVSGIELDKKKEDEANRFASELLLSHSQLKEILMGGEITLTKVMGYSEMFLTPPGAIVGRLQHLGIIKYSHLNELKRKVRFTTPS